MSRPLITEGISDEDASHLPQLTEQQAEFVHQMLQGKTATDAYRAAYPTTSTWQVASIWRKATEAKSNVKVAAWLSAARKANLGAASITLRDHLTELERLKEIALEKGNVGAAVQAELNRGKAMGLYVEKIEHQLKDHDPERTLEEIAQVDPDLAAAMAKKAGIPWIGASETESEARH